MVKRRSYFWTWTRFIISERHLFILDRY
jgi:hypothetical protein